jgi:hypothetical protein
MTGVNFRNLSGEELNSPEHLERRRAALMTVNISGLLRISPHEPAIVGPRMRRPRSQRCLGPQVKLDGRNEIVEII